MNEGDSGRVRRLFVVWITRLLLCHVISSFAPVRPRSPKAYFATMSSDSEEQKEPVAKKSKTEGDEQSAPVKRDDQGDAYFELSRNRRYTVRKWKNAVLVDIRETYEKDGQTRPGKKGISLTHDQFKTLAAAIKDGSIEEQINELN